MKWTKDVNDIYVFGEDEKVISYPEEGNNFCFGIEDNSSWFNQRNELILKLCHDHKIEGNFIDIGGGNGYQARALINSNFKGEVYLCEPGYQGCLNAKRRGVENVYNGFFQDFNFEQNQIKACGLFDVIEHIEDDITFLNELYTQLPDYAKVLINVPASRVLWSEVDEVAGHFRRYTKKDLTRIERKTSFKVVYSSYYFPFYYIPLFALRVIPYKLGIRRGSEEILAAESKNHTSNKGLIDKLLNWRHKIWLKRLPNKKPKFGTSLFFILQK